MHRDRMRERLELINSVVLDFFKLNREPFREAWSRRIKSDVKPVDFWISPDRALAKLLLNLFGFGAMRSFNMLMYATAQQSPKRPYQAEKIAERLDWLDEHSHGEKVRIVLAPNGVTRGAYVILKKRAKAYVVRSVHDVKRILAKYFEKKWQLLMAAVKRAGGKIYGPLAALMAILAMILRRLGYVVPSITLVKLIDAALGGPEAEADGLPPPTPPPDS